MHTSIVLSCLLVVACSSSGTPTETNHDAASGTGDSSSPNQDAERSSKDSGAPKRDGGPTGDAAIVCNTLRNSATPLTATVSRAEPAVGTGGSVAGGTYTLTSLVILDEALQDAGSAPPVSITISISGTTVESVTTTDGKTLTGTATFTTSGASWTETTMCPREEPSRGLTFTATPTTLTLYGTLTTGHSTGSSVETFTKQ